MTPLEGRAWTTVCNMSCSLTRILMQGTKKNQTVEKI